MTWVDHLISYLCLVVMGLCLLALASCERTLADLCPGGTALFKPQPDITAYELALIIEAAPRAKVICLRRDEAIPDAFRRHFKIVPP